MSQEKINVYGIYYDSYDHPLYELHTENKKGRYYIQKKMIPKDQQERFFHDGQVVLSQHMDEYPIVKLMRSNGRDKMFDDCLMTDTPYEIETNRQSILFARGDVLECGLGIGYFTYHANLKKQVKSITIVEKNKEVIDLVYPVIKSEKTKIIHEDAIKFMKKTKKKFDMINIDFEGGMLPFAKTEMYRKLGERISKPKGTVSIWQEQIWDRVKQNIKKGKRNSKGFGYHQPCAGCGKVLRHDYDGFCMDCADELGISELGFKL